MTEAANGNRLRTGVRVFAEFAVIVFGVLVAFSVEDWGNERADRLLEEQYLDALATDLRVDSVNLATFHIPNLTRRLTALEAIWPVARGAAPVPVDTIGFLQEVARSHRTPFLTAGGRTFEELLATGSLRLLESAELRSALVEYYRSRNVAAVRSQSRESGYADLVRAYLPEAVGSSRVPIGDQESEALLRRFGVSEAVEAVRTAEFVRSMNQQFNYLYLIRPTLDDLLDELEELIPRVDRELERLN